MRFDLPLQTTFCKHDIHHAINMIWVKIMPMPKRFFLLFHIDQIERNRPADEKKYYRLKNRTDTEYAMAIALYWL
jgi:hypothetical protein